MMLNTLFIIILLIPSQWGREDNRGAWGLSRWGYEFNPAQYNPIVWYQPGSDVKDASFVAADSGDAVAYLYDHLGAADTLKQTTGSRQPVYRTNVVNGHPVISFDGTSDALTQTGLMSALNATAFDAGFVYHIVFAVDDGDPSASCYVWGAFNASAGAADCYFYTGYDVDSDLRTRLYADNVMISHETIKIPSYRTPFYVVSVLADSTDSLQVIINGELQSKLDLKALNWDGIDSTPGDVDEVSVGNYSADGTLYTTANWFDGDFGELIIYPTVQTYGQVLNVHRWLQDKYHVGDFEFAISAITDISLNTKYDMCPCMSHPSGARDSVAVLVYRESTQHATDTSLVVEWLYDIDAGTWTKVDTLLSDLQDYRVRGCLQIGDTLNYWVYRAMCDDEDWAMTILKSTDGGVTWEAPDTIQSGISGDFVYTPVFNFVETNTPGHYINLGYKAKSGANVGTIVIETSDSGATWDYYTDRIPNWTNYNEGHLCHIGGGRMIGWLRGDTGVNGLWQIMSSDNGLTWSTPIEATIDGTDICTYLAVAPFLYYDSTNDLVIGGILDRNGTTDGNNNYVAGNPDEVFSDPSLWHGLKVPESGMSYCGYSCGVKISAQEMMMVYSKQMSASDADLKVFTLTIH